MNNKERKEPSSENNPSNIGVTEIIIEDLKTIESSSGLLQEALATITIRAKQARGILETQLKEQPKKETPSHSFRNEYGGPWSNALRSMYLKAQREKRGIKLREPDPSEGSI